MLVSSTLQCLTVSTEWSIEQSGKSVRLSKICQSTRVYQSDGLLVSPEDGLSFNQFVYHFSQQLNPSINQIHVVLPAN